MVPLVVFRETSDAPKHKMLLELLILKHDFCGNKKPLLVLIQKLHYMRVGVVQKYLVF